MKCKANSNDESTIRASVSRSQPHALLCIIAAWFVGTCVCESLSWSREPSRSTPIAEHQRFASETGTFSGQWHHRQTELAIEKSGIKNFVRMKLNNRVRPLLEKMIRNELAILAMRASAKSVRTSPANVEVDADWMTADPVVEAMPVARAAWMEAYRKLDESRERLLLTNRTIDRLVWDEAQSSSLPGLVRLVSVDSEPPTEITAVKIIRARPRVLDATGSNRL